MEDSYKRNIDQGNSSFDNLDLDKLRSILLKSLPYVIVIMALTISAAAIAIRYTKPLYQSNSVIQIDVKSEAKVLGFRSFDDDINNLAREIEIIKSRLFLSKVAEALNFEVSYYQYGDILFEERYNSSPFEVIPIEVSPTLFNQKIDLDITDARTYELKLSRAGNERIQTFHFSDTISVGDLRMVVELNAGYDPNIDNRYFFTINSNESIVSYINRNLTVEPLDFKAKTITVSFKDHHRQKSNDIVTAIDTLYLYYTQLDKNKTNKQKIDFLNEQLSQTEEKLTELETYFENFTIDNKTTNLDANLSRTIEQLEALDSQKFVVQNQLNTFNDLYDKIIAENELEINLAEVSFFSGGMQQELERLDQLYQDKNILLSSYNENTLAYQKKMQEIGYLKDRVLKYIEATREKLYQNLDIINKRRYQLETEFVELPSKRTEYSKTQRYYGLYEEFYLSLMKNKAEFELAQAGTVTDYRILSSASVSSTPISPNKLLYYGVGIFGGLIFSFMFIGIRYLLHNKISNQQELERSTNAFVLGTIPLYPFKSEDNSRFVVNKHLKSSISEAFRSLRSNLEFLSGHNDKTIISITSTVSGEGKTFVATNLGGIISLLKSKVILIDLDMRKPRFQEVFDHADTSKGLSTVLISKHKFEDCIQKTEIENLDFIPAGPIPPNPSELVLGSAFTELIEKLKHSYDVIIIDTPPVGLVTDGIHALKIATIPIYVFRADFSKKSYLKNVNRLVKVNKLNNLSLILNSLKNNSVSSYGYSKGYYEENTSSHRKKLKGIFHLFS